MTVKGDEEREITLANVPPILTEVEVITATDIWLAGQCGRVWHYDGTTLVEHKSQTDAHTWGTSFPSTTRGYLGAHRQTDTQTAVVRYKK